MMESLWHWQTHGSPLALLLLSILFALGLVVVVLWLTLPFALFGTKRLLREILEAQRETNEHLQELHEVIRCQSEKPSREQTPSDWHL